jgi:hypothetical protein
MMSLVDERTHTAKQRIAQLCGSYGDAILASARVADGPGKRIRTGVARGKHHQEISVRKTVKLDKFVLAIHVSRNAEGRLTRTHQRLET